MNAAFHKNGDDAWCCGDRREGRSSPSEQMKWEGNVICSLQNQYSVFEVISRYVKRIQGLSILLHMLL
jgi:hypothetical protein